MYSCWRSCYADLGDVVFTILSQPCPPHSERAQVKQHEWASTVSTSTRVSGVDLLTDTMTLVLPSQTLSVLQSQSLSKSNQKERLWLGETIHTGVACLQAPTPVMPVFSTERYGGTAEP